MSKSHIKGSAGAMRLDAHRPCLVDLECEDCAPEGGIQPAPRVPRQRERVGIAAVLTVFAIAIFAALAAIHFGAPTK